MNEKCGCNQPDIMILPCSGDTCEGRLDIKNTDRENLDPDDVAAVKHAVRLACKRPVKKVFDSPRPLSPGDRARSRQLGANAADLAPSREITTNDERVSD